MDWANGLGGHSLRMVFCWPKFKNEYFTKTSKKNGFFPGIKNNMVAMKKTLFQVLASVVIICFSVPSNLVG
jgi:hypothetical protein